MSDTVSTEQRSWIMSRVRDRDTRPELLVRSLVHRLGYRYRLHKQDLPGAPDLVFAKHRKIILVHGCFWHGHECRRGNRLPKTNQVYWRGKITRTKLRDGANLVRLRELGWRYLIIWECQTTDRDLLLEALSTFLGESPH